MQIKLDDLSHPKIALLLEEHLADMHATSPPESIHALDLEKLTAEDIYFWSVWSEEDLLGCGALKRLDHEHYEIKSMRTAKKHIRKGVAGTLLNYIIEFSKSQGFQQLSLETGSQPFFTPAHQLYLKFGFEFCPAFADYTDDPNSRFMTLRLNL